MKTIALRLSILVPAGLLASLLLFASRASSYTNGAPSSSSGAPGDISTCVQCHGAQSTEKPGWITSTVPATGFEYNTTYTFTLTATHAGAAKIGFEASVEDPSEQKSGTLIVTDATRTQLVGTDWITHTSAGVVPTNNSNTWSFDWTSPAGSKPYMMLYVCFAAGDGNGLATGDRLYTSRFNLFHNTTAGLAGSDADGFGVWPNPASDDLFVHGTGASPLSLRILDDRGSILLEALASPGSAIDVSALSPGLYLIQAEQEGRWLARRFLKI